MPRPDQVCEEEGPLLSWHGRCVGYSVMERNREPLEFEALRDAVDLAFAAWTDVSCNDDDIDLAVRQTEELSLCAEPEHNPTGGNVNTIAFVSDWAGEGHDVDTFALTKVWHNKQTGEIVGADMLLNEAMGAFADCGNRDCPDGEIDLQNVVTHEAGHFLGLGHSPSPNASMYFQARAGEVRKRQLNEDDRSGLCSLYGGTDGGNNCELRDFAPQGGFERHCVVQPPSGCACGIGGPQRTPTASLSCLALGLLVSRIVRRRRWARRRHKPLTLDRE